MDRSQKGFSLLELVVVIAILIAIMGVVTPYVLGMLDDAKVSKIVQTYERVSKAVQEYHNDLMAGDPSLTKTDALLLPSEIQGTHDLFYDPGLKGWKGPYLSHPLNGKDNPFNGLVRVMNYGTMTWNPAFQTDGWQIQGPSMPGYIGDGAYITFSDIEEEFAKKVDDVIDGKVLGSDGLAGSQSVDWWLYGKCRWESSGWNATNCLHIWISDLDGK